MAGFIHSAAAMTAASTFRLVVQFATVPFLSRYLTPHEYGIVALAMPIVVLVMMVSDAGICNSLIRDRVHNLAAWSSAFWLLAIGGAMVTLLVAAGSPLVGILYGDPTVAVVLAVLSTAILLQAVTNVAVADLQRARRYGRLAAIESTATALSVGITVVLAMRGYSYWALVAQQLVFWLVRCAATWWSCRLRLAFAFDWKAVLPHLKHGYQIVRTVGVGFLARNIDPVLVGILQGTREAGLYAMATQLMRLPATIIVGPLFNIVLTICAPSQDDRAAVARIFLAVTSVVGSLVIPPMFVAAAAHAAIFDLLLSPKWHEAGWIFALIAPVGAVQSVTLLSFPVLQVLGRPEIPFKVSLESGITWLLFATVALHISIEAAAIAMTFAFLIYLPRFLSLVIPLIGCSASGYGRALMVPIALGVVGAGLYLLTVKHVPPNAQFTWPLMLSIAGLGAGCALLASRTSLAALRRL